MHLVRVAAFESDLRWFGRACQPATSRHLSSGLTRLLAVTQLRCKKAALQ